MSIAAAPSSCDQLRLNFWPPSLVRYAMSDLRLALRAMVRQPGMSALAVIALALGIGLTTTMFSIVNGEVIRGLTFPESDRILHAAPFSIPDQDDMDMRVHAYAEFASRQQS